MFEEAGAEICQDTSPQREASFVKKDMNITMKALQKDLI